MSKEILTPEEITSKYASKLGINDLPIKYIESTLKDYHKQMTESEMKEMEETRICITCGKKFITTDGWLECDLCYHHSF